MSTPLELHQGFLAMVPRIQGYARAYFRFVRCPDRLADLAAEAVALAWAWYVRLTVRGKDPRTFAATFVHRALLAVRCHRRLCGFEAGKDALSPLAQGRHHFSARPLPAHDSGDGDPVLDALADDTHARPADQAAFRVDFPAWLHQLPGRKRRIALALLVGDRPRDVARKYGVSPGRVSQIRAELFESWRAFCGDAA